MRRNQKGFSILEIIFIIVAVCIVGLVGSHFYKLHKVDSNTKYFNTLNTRTKTYYDEQAKALGAQSPDKDLVKKCYRTEQGPFNNGNLWCGVSVTKKINVQPDEASLQQKITSYTNTLKSEGFGSSLYGSAASSNGFSASGNKRNDGDEVCSTHITYSPFSAYPDAKTTMAYSLDCSKHSTGMVDGFIDDSHN